MLRKVVGRKTSKMFLGEKNIKGGGSRGSPKTVMGN